VYWSANDLEVPVVIEVHVVPGICTGDEYSVVLFCPNCPGTLLPHAHKVPSVLIAKELLLAEPIVVPFAATL